MTAPKMLGMVMGLCEDGSYHICLGVGLCAWVGTEDDKWAFEVGNFPRGSHEYTSAQAAANAAGLHVRELVCQLNTLIASADNADPRLP